MQPDNWLAYQAQRDPEVAFVANKLDQDVLNEVLNYDRRLAVAILKKVYAYRLTVNNFSSYTRKLLREQMGHSPQGRLNAMSPGPSPSPAPKFGASVLPREPFQAETTQSVKRRCQENPLPSSTTDLARRCFYDSVVAKVHEKRVRDGVMAEPMPQRPSDSDLGHMYYTAVLQVDKDTRRIVHHYPRVTEKTRRLLDRFGSDRVLFVDLPNQGVTLRHLDYISVGDRRFEFLISKRTQGPAKDLVESDDQAKVKGGYVVAIFFAVCGLHIEPVTIARIRDWHLPLDFAIKKNMGLPKYVDRFRLALSGVTRTIELRPEDIVLVDDFKGCEGLPNTDGNGLISANLLDAVARHMGHVGRRISAIQVRLGPAKGMLVRSDRDRDRVFIFREQFKYGPDDYYHKCEPQQRMIEVCRVVFADQEARSVGRLNSQLILVLQSIGCPASVFTNLYERRLQEIESIVSSGNLFQSDLLPSPDAAAGGRVPRTKTFRSTRSSPTKRFFWSLIRSWRSTLPRRDGVVVKRCWRT